jgi:hypothetical protein
MKQNTKPGKSSLKNPVQTDFHGACIITDTGEEIPITEQMLQNAFNDLIELWEKSRQQPPHT